jgi:hypothetical protein
MRDCMLECRLVICCRVTAFRPSEIESYNTAAAIFCG